jgi:hypothetical protein
MKYRHSIMILVPMISTCFAAFAQEVYENVDKQGVVEFSDQPGPDAKPVDVRPNVVDVVPVKPMKASPPASPTGAAKAPADNVQPLEIQRGVSTNYDDEREARRKRELRMDRSGEAVQKPGHKVVGKPAGHKGAHRK